MDAYTHRVLGMVFSTLEERLVYMSSTAFYSVLLAFCLTLLFVGMFSNATYHSYALWRIVHDECADNQKSNNNPSPCEYVDLNKGYAVLKDDIGHTQFLVIPTQRVSGIESPEILDLNATNYWQAAWGARGYVFRQLGHELPGVDIGMAINSPFGRTQNQLHIHVDCLQPEVIRGLAMVKKRLNENWLDLPFTLSGHTYQARLVRSDDLHDINPFNLLADGQHDMSRETLVVAGSDPGFVLLADAADISQGDTASGEELLDHACAVGKKAQ
jgi:CDP-diacylglycerol pyrophosphatase